MFKTYLFVYFCNAFAKLFVVFNYELILERFCNLKQIVFTERLEDSSPRRLGHKKVFL